MAFKDFIFTANSKKKGTAIDIKINDGDYGEAWLTENEAGSGSFMLEVWNRGQNMTLAANKDYWCKVSQLEKVEIKFIPEPATLRMMLETGELDMPEGLTMEAMDQLQDVEGIVSRSKSFRKSPYIAYQYGI